jgi:hypothetical protein
MIRSLAKMVAYSRAPKTTFTLAHPRDAMKLRSIRRELRRSPLPKIAAIGAAVIALPIGIAIGRLSAGRSNGLT